MTPQTSSCDDPRIAYAQAGYRYAQDVVAGLIPAGRYVKLACQRHLQDLERSKQDSYPYRFDESLGGRICLFIEQLPHVDGVWDTPNIELLPWQKFILSTVYGWVRKSDGLRRFQRAYLAVPRKNGKSTMAAGIGLYGLCADGEQGAQVYCAATTLRQALYVFHPAKIQAERTPKLFNRYGLQVNAQSLVVPGTNSRFTPICSNPGDGGGASTFICDEFHEHTDAVLFDAITRGMGARRQPLTWIITTAGSNIAGPCFDLERDIKSILEGTFERERTFACVYGLDSEPYTTALKFPSAIEHITTSCTCHLPTHPAKVWREVCLKTRLNVPTIPTETCTVKGFAQAVTKSSAHGQEFPKSGEQLGTNSTRSVIQNAGVQLGPDGCQNLEALESSETATYARLTESTSVNTNACSQSKVGCAAYAGSSVEAYTWITATAQAMLEDSSANSATLQLAFSETLAKLYNEHSPTCNVRKASLRGTSLLVACPPDRWDTIESGQKANPSWGVSVIPDTYANELEEAVQNASKQGSFRTKRLNEWLNAASGYFNMAAWQACEDPTLSPDDFTGEECHIGLDLAAKLDLCAAVKVFTKEIDDKRHYYVFPTCYLPDEQSKRAEHAHYAKWALDGHLKTTPGNITDYEYILEDIRSDTAQFRVAELCFDQYGAAHLTQRIEAETGITLVDIPQNVRYLSEPLKALQSLIIDGRIHHNGHPVLKWCVSNVVAREDVNENVFPRKAKPELKIDAVSALLNALSRLPDDLTPPPPPEQYTIEVWA